MTEQDSFRTKKQIIFYDYINNTHTHFKALQQSWQPRAPWQHLSFYKPFATS